MTRHAAFVETLPASSGNLPPHPEAFNVPHTTMGREIVELADRLEYHAAQPGDLYARIFAEKEGAELHEKLGNIREDLRSLSPEEKQLLAPHIQALLYDYLSPEAANNPEIVDRLSRAHDKKLLLLLRRNAVVIEQQQHDGAQHIARRKELYASRINEGITSNEAWISTDAFTIAARVAGTEVEVGDYWETHIKGHGGSYDRETGRIVISQGLGRTRAERSMSLHAAIDHAHDHEQNHKHFGSKLPVWLYWFDEAMAEHVRLSLRDGDPQEIDPQSRRNDSGIYTAFRSLASAVVTEAPGRSIEEVQLTRAYTSDGMHSPDWLAMEQSLDRNWGIDSTLQRVSARYVQYTDFLKKQHPDWTEFAVWDAAAATTRDELLSDPRFVFGVEYLKPQPRMGAAAMAGTVR